MNSVPVGEVSERRFERGQTAPCSYRGIGLNRISRMYRFSVGTTEAAWMTRSRSAATRRLVGEMTRPTMVDRSIIARACLRRSTS